MLISSPGNTSPCCSIASDSATPRFIRLLREANVAFICGGSSRFIIICIARTSETPVASMEESSRQKSASCLAFSRLPADLWISSYSSMNSFCLSRLSLSCSGFPAAVFPLTVFPLISAAVYLYSAKHRRPLFSVWILETIQQSYRQTAVYAPQKYPCGAAGQLINKQKRSTTNSCKCFFPS